MTIAHITTVVESVQSFLLQQLLSLQTMGHEVIAISSSGPDARLIQDAGIEHIPLQISRRVRPLTDVLAVFRLSRILRDRHVGIVHTHTPKATVIGQLAARLAAVPIRVDTVHGLYLHEGLSATERAAALLIHRIVYRLPDLVLSQNREDLDFMLREHMCKPERLRHLGNGIDIGAFDRRNLDPNHRLRRRAALNIPGDAPIIGFVGRLSLRRKGFADFLTASLLIRQLVPAARFLVVGAPDTPRPDSFDPRIDSDSELLQPFVFTGARPNADLPGLYNAMDVVVLPSIFEGMPRVVMEASAMSVPCVVTDVKGNREVVAHGINGFLVPYGSPPSIAQAVVKILSDPSLALRMGVEGRRIACERFNQNRVFATVRAEYEQLIRKQYGSLVPLREK